MRQFKYRVYPFDLLVIGYCILMVATILVFGRPMSEYLDEIAFYLGLAAMATLIVRLVDEGLGGWQRLVRLFYPAFMFAFMYHETGGTMFLLFDRFFDADLTSFEQALFGGDISLYLDRNTLSTFRNELFSACYFAYYLMIPALLSFLYLTRRDEMTRRFLTASSLAFFVSYILFFLYPIEGPRYFFAGQYINQVHGPFFRQLVNLVIDTGAVRGGCMPSSHVGVALVVLVYVFRISRKAGWLLLPVNIGLAAGTVWGRFHYVSDVLVGAAIGLASVWLVSKYYDSWSQSACPTITQRELRAEHVS